MGVQSRGTKILKMSFIPLICAVLALSTPDALGLTEDRRSSGSSESFDLGGLDGLKALFSQMLPGVPTTMLDSLLSKAGDMGGSGSGSNSKRSSGSGEGFDLGELDGLKALFSQMFPGVPTTMLDSLLSKVEDMGGSGSGSSRKRSSGSGESFWKGLLAKYFGSGSFSKRSSSSEEDFDAWKALLSQMNPDVLSLLLAAAGQKK